jgi:hypothetical protein
MIIRNVTTRPKEIQLNSGGVSILGHSEISAPDSDADSPHLLELVRMDQCKITMGAASPTPSLAKRNKADNDSSKGGQ